MSERIFKFDNSDPAMQRANESARQSFKYFWREMSWERRRIIPAFNMMVVKLPFTDGPRTDGNADYEQMWISDVEFDGETVSGKLINSPNWLTSVKAGDPVTMPFANLTDWMITSGDGVYGAFTVNLMRSQMSSRERKDHDAAWGLNFGDPSTIRVEISYETKPKGGFLSGLFGKRAAEPKPAEGFKDHPMCVNMLEKLETFLKEEPKHVHEADETGWTMLQREALSGNLGVVKILVSHGADRHKQTPTGKTASQLAHTIGWPEIAEYLDAAR